MLCSRCLNRRKRSGRVSWATPPRFRLLLALCCVFTPLLWTHHPGKHTFAHTFVKIEASTRNFQILVLGCTRCFLVYKNPRLSRRPRCPFCCSDSLFFFFFLFSLQIILSVLSYKCLVSIYLSTPKSCV